MIERTDQVYIEDKKKHPICKINGWYVCIPEEDIEEILENPKLVRELEEFEPPNDEKENNSIENPWGVFYTKDKEGKIDMILAY